MNASSILSSFDFKQELTALEVEESVIALLDPKVDLQTKANFLLKLRQRGETTHEILYYAKAFLNRAVDPQINLERLSGPMIDVCGTGGDGLHLFNVSTTVSFILAAGGAVVVKHGNRAISSLSGGADVLLELGISTRKSPKETVHSLEKHQFGFFFAPDYHPAFSAIAPVRQQLAAQGHRTIFNILGPLINPARPPRQLVGVFDLTLTSKFAEILAQLGREYAWAVHGLIDGSSQGMDEFSTLGSTMVEVCKNGKKLDQTRIFLPQEAGIQTALHLCELQGGNAHENAKTTYKILSGEITDSRRDLVLLNAAAGFCVAGITSTLKDGAQLAAKQIVDKHALAKLTALQKEN